MVTVVDSILSFVGIVLILVGVGTAYASFTGGGLTIDGSMISIVSLGLGAICCGLSAIINLLTGQVNR